VPQPDKVDKAEVLRCWPHGTGTVTVMQGGLEIMNEGRHRPTVIARPPPSCGWTYRERAMTQKRVILELAPATTCMAATTPGRPARRAGCAASFLARLLRALKVNRRPACS